MPASRLIVAAIGAALLVTSGLARADQVRPPLSSSLLHDLGFTLGASGPDKNTITFTKGGLLVPTPWGDIEATIVSTPVDRMVRVPLSPNTDLGQSRVTPYVTAGARKNVDGDAAFEHTRATAFGDSGRTNLKAGAGLLFKVDDNVEVFGEYQFMRLQRDADSRGLVGPLRNLDPSGFSLGISVRY